VEVILDGDSFLFEPMNQRYARILHCDGAWLVRFEACSPGEEVCVAVVQSMDTGHPLSQAVVQHENEQWGVRLEDEDFEWSWCSSDGEVVASLDVSFMKSLLLAETASMVPIELDAHVYLEPGACSSE
jgi:hypothetical protein